MKWWERVTPEYVKKNTDGSPEQVMALTYANQLHDLLSETDPFPRSTTQKNRDIDPGLSERELFDRYVQEMPEYESTKNYSQSKTDFRGYGTNIGYKLHLNVPISRIRYVANYLQKEEFCHKYLSGGEILDGKVFTIYTGSRSLTERMAQKISTDLGDVLARPMEHNDEREIAQNISGRFNVRGGDFVQYGNGLKGIPMLREDAVRLLYTKDPEARKTIIDLAFKKSFIKLKDLFGEYFYGA
jgi:hypothetical protein